MWVKSPIDLETNVGMKGRAMFKSLEFTLYDVLGYLFPGAIAVTAVVIFIWAIFFPGSPLLIPGQSRDFWLIGSVTAYFAGHLMHGVGNIIENIIARRLPKREEEFFDKQKRCDQQDHSLRKIQRMETCMALAEKVRSEIKSKGIEPNQMEARALFEFCDETVAQSGIVTDREIYVYVEGFYRATFVALAFLTIALAVIGVLQPKSAIEYQQGRCLALSRWLLFFGALLSFSGSWLAFNRFKRFGRHRVRRAVVGFLVLESSKREKRVREPS